MNQSSLIPNNTFRTRDGECGFSIVEMICAMTILLTVFGLTAQLISFCWNVQNRESTRIAARSEVYRALNMIEREATTSGYDLKSNGIVAPDSDAQSIRFRANLNAYDLNVPSGVQTVSEAGEDVKYKLVGTDLVRLDVNLNQTSVLASEVTTLQFRYFGGRVTIRADGCQPTIDTGTSAEVTPDQATFFVVTVCRQLPAVGAPGSDGYQPPDVYAISHGVVLRNSVLSSY